MRVIRVYCTILNFMEQYIYIYIFHYLENTDIANYANDNTLSSPEKNKEIVINATETSLVPFN